MHQEFRLSDKQTVFYRYNPQADVLAVRFTSDFKAAEERPLPANAAISVSHDLDGGAAVGLRISGVQQMILQSLIRDAFGLAAPALGLAAPAAAFALQADEPSTRPAAQPVVQPAVRTEPPTVALPPAADLVSTIPVAIDAVGDDDAFDDEDAIDPPDSPAGDGDAAEPRRRRRRRRRRPGQNGGGHAAAADGDDVLVSIAPARVILPQVIESPAPTQDPADAVADVAFDRLPSHADLPRSISASPDVAPSEVAAGDRVGETDVAPHVSTAAAQDAESDRRRRRRRRGRRGADGMAGVGAEFLAEDDGDDLPGDPEAEAHWDDEGRPCPETFAPLRLHPRVAHAISDLGFSSPTPIQVEAIPVALSGEDLVGLAQTGTGKTLAFVAPSLTRLLSGDRPGNRPRMVILTPTRELAIQVALEAERLAAHTDLRVATIYGGVSMGQQTDDLRRGVDVVVATPGRILDHLRRRNVQLDAVEVLVLDEADRMLDMGFLPDVRAIIRQLPGQRQTMLFTATFPPEIESLSLEFQHKPRTVEIARRKPPESIDQRLYPVGRHLKAPLLVHLLETDPTMDRVLIFTERKIDADVLARKLRQDGISVALMHGDRTQVEREQALAALKSRKVRVLVATNVAARGLDIEEISHVVNYDVPQSIDEYVHRIGRTARAESEGKAYSFVTAGDETMVSRIEAALGRQLPRVQAPGFDYDVTPPSWAKLSGSDVLALLNKETSTVDRLRSLSRRRR